MFKFILAYIVGNTKIGIPQKTIEYKKPKNEKAKSQIVKSVITKRR